MRSAPGLTGPLGGDFMNIIKPASIMLSAAILSAQPASAVVYNLTVTGHLNGTIAPTIDVAGIFGVAGAELGGKAFKTVYTIDTSEPWVITPPEVGSHTKTYQSGINPYYSRGEAITASVTINGRTVSNIGRSQSGTSYMTGVGSQQLMAASDTYFRNGIPQNYDQLQLNLTTSGNYPSVTFVVNGVQVNTISTNVAFGAVGDIIDNAYFPRPFNVPLDVYKGNGQFSVGGYKNGQAIGFNAYYVLENATFSVAGVPEPAVWAMMLSGFGFVGGVARHRRKKSTVVFAPLPAVHTIPRQQKQLA